MRSTLYSKICKFLCICTSTAFLHTSQVSADAVDSSETYEEFIEQVATYNEHILNEIISYNRAVLIIGSTKELMLQWDSWRLINNTYWSRLVKRCGIDTSNRSDPMNLGVKYISRLDTQSLLKSNSEKREKLWSEYHRKYSSEPLPSIIAISSWIRDFKLHPKTHNEKSIRFTISDYPDLSRRWGSIPNSQDEHFKNFTGTRIVDEFSSEEFFGEKSENFIDIQFAYATCQFATSLRNLTDQKMESYTFQNSQKFVGIFEKDFFFSVQP